MLEWYEDIEEVIDKVRQDRVKTREHRGKHSLSRDVSKVGSLLSSFPVTFLLPLIRLCLVDLSFVATFFTLFPLSFFAGILAFRDQNPFPFLSPLFLITLTSSLLPLFCRRWKKRSMAIVSKVSTSIFFRKTMKPSTAYLCAP